MTVLHIIAISSLFATFIKKGQDSGFQLPQFIAWRY